MTHHFHSIWKWAYLNEVWITLYPKKYAHGFVVICFVGVMQSFIMNSHEVFIHIHQGCFAGAGAIVRLPQCQWSKPDGYGKISQCITTTKHSKAKTVCIFLGIYCKWWIIEIWSWLKHIEIFSASQRFTHIICFKCDKWNKGNLTISSYCRIWASVN